MLTPTIVSTHKRAVLVGLVVLALAGVGVVWAYMSAPMFVQLGETHYLAGGQLYTRTQGEGYADYKATRESFWRAIVNDPNLLNWLPIKMEAL